MKILLALAMLLMIGGSKNNQPFEGTITYTVVVTDDDPDNNNGLPKEIKSYHKDGKMRLDVDIDEVRFTVISDVKTDEVAFMMNAQGLKMALKTNKSDLTQELQNEVNSTTVEHIKYHKKIANIKCHKAIIRKDGEVSTAFIADQLNAEGFAWIFNKQLDGTLMEFRKVSEDSEVHIFATKVTPEPLDERKFELPSDHITIAISDIGQLFENGLFQ